MTVLLILALVAGLFAVWERVDAVRRVLEEDITYLLEELAQPPRDGLGTTRPTRRGASRR